MKAGLSTIGTSAMENVKLIEEDVVEEHNGVYGEKWHIVSLEGFDLPEGLEYVDEYIRQKFEGKSFKKIIKLTKLDITLDELFEKMSKMLLFSDRIVNLEIVGCKKRKKDSNFEVPFPNLSGLAIHFCELTFKDLYDIVSQICSEDFEFDFDNNMFDEVGKDWKWIDMLESLLKDMKEVGHRIGFFSLKNCGFNDAEKSLLFKKLQVYTIYL